MNKQKEKKLTPKIVACLIAGSIIGCNAYTLAWGRPTYYYDGGGSTIVTHTCYGPEPTHFFNAYLAERAPIIPLADSAKKTELAKTFTQAQKIVGEYQKIAKSTQELLSLFRLKNINLNGGVFNKANDVLKTASTITTNSKFDINKSWKGSNLKLNTRLTFKGLQDPDKVKQYQNDLMNENLEINNEANNEIAKLTAEIMICQNAIKKVISEEDFDSSLDATERAEIAKSVSKINSEIKDAEKSLSNTTSSKEADIVKSYLANDGKYTTQTFIDAIAGSKSSLMAGGGQEYYNLLQKYGNDVGTAIFKYNDLNAAREDLANKKREYEVLKNEFESLLAYYSSYYYNRYMADGDYSYFSFGSGEGYSWIEERLDELQTQMRYKKQQIEEVKVIVQNYSDDFALLTQLSEGSKDNTKDNKGLDIDTLTEKKLKNLDNDAGNGSSTNVNGEVKTTDNALQSSLNSQESALAKTNSFESSNKDMLNATRTSKGASNSILQSLANSLTGYTSSQIDKALSDYEMNISSRSSAVNTLTSSNNNNKSLGSTTSDHEQYKKALSEVRDKETDKKVAEGGDKQSKKLEMQKSVLINALTARITILQRQIEQVKEKRDMYQEQTMKRLREIDENKALNNTMSLTSRDPWHQSDKDKEKHPTRKGFGLKKFAP